VCLCVQGNVKGGAVETLCVCVCVCVVITTHMYVPALICDSIGLMHCIPRCHTVQRTMTCQLMCLRFVDYSRYQLDNCVFVYLYAHVCEREA